MHLMYGVCHELQLLQKHSTACSLSLKIPHYKKRKKEGGGGEIFIKFASHRQAACFSFILSCDCSMASRQPLQPTHKHTFIYCWPVRKVITGRLLHAFMKYSNGSMSYCALIMPHKDKKRRRRRRKRTRRRRGRHRRADRKQ